MSKKFSKLLIGAALVGAAAGVVLAYLNKYKMENENWEDDFEDFEENFDDELDADETSSAADASREYVTIPTPTEESYYNSEEPVSE